jgi:hypothetical protein
MMKKRLKEYDDITVPINEIRDHINDILENKKKELYFDGIVLLYSFIENILKWLVAVKILWDKSDKEMAEKEVRVIREFCRRMTFSSALQMALFFKLIDFELYKKIDTIRDERNSIIHQYWFYIHRRNRLILRKKLEKLAGTASELVGLFNKLTEEIGVGEVYAIFL